MSRRWLIAAAVVVLAAVAAMLLWPKRIAGEARREDAARLMNELMSGRSPVGGTFALRDTSGVLRSLEEFRGRLVVLYFGYTYCPDVCPTDLAVIASMLRALGPRADEVQPVFVTLDPERDTPGILREYVAAFHPRIVALRGGEDETRRIATSYKVFYEKVREQASSTYLIDHAAFTFLLGRDGRFIGLFPPGTKPDRMATMVRESLQ